MSADGDKDEDNGYGRSEEGSDVLSLIVMTRLVNVSSSKLLAIDDDDQNDEGET